MLSKIKLDELCLSEMGELVDPFVIATLRLRIVLLYLQEVILEQDLTISIF